ncbi:hypothetical protein WR25_13569 [Diploscapter pachys]|uniref:Uncharacterized protein n=1 Tax=Diploscapter pachys TaxID=2018661 RepID=A0A2A2JCI4_9BILA|nr:hypothetical protein WR25_13569 [Diploscapter pachys]
MPDFMKEVAVNESLCDMFEQIYIHSHLSQRRKFNALDKISELMDFETKKKYRVWRFPFFKGKVPNFADGEEEGLKKSVELLFGSTQDLTDFCRCLWHLMGAFKNEKRLYDYFISECMMRPTDLFPHFCRVKWTCKWMKDGKPHDKKWSILIKPIASTLTDDFLRIMTKDNDFGVRGGAVQFAGDILTINGTCNVSFKKTLPDASPLTKKSQPCQLEKFNVPSKAGDIFLSVYDRTELQIIVVQKNGICVRDDLTKIGEIQDIPEAFPKSDTSKETLPFKIIDTFIV